MKAFSNFIDSKNHKYIQIQIKNTSKGTLRIIPPSGTHFPLNLAPLMFLSRLSIQCVDTN